MALRRVSACCFSTLSRSRALAFNQVRSAPTSSHEEEIKSNWTLDEIQGNHVPLTFLQRSLLAAGSAAVSLFDPSRDDMIAILGETTGEIALKRLKRLMEQDDEGSLILRERPRINSSTVDLNALEKLDPNTFGFHYAQFLKKNGVTPDTRLPVRFVDDPELGYVLQRYREIHDLVHTILGMPTNMLGEVCVKWFEAIQFRLPMCMLAATGGPLRLRPKHRQKYLTTHLEWSIRCARQSRLLLNVYFEKHWSKDVDKLRAEINLIPALSTK